MKILVVEDETAIRNNLVRMLQLEQFEVAGAANGKLALEMVHEFAPDLILCDVMMPELDGFGVLTALREDERTEAIPLVFLTALDDRENLRRAMGLGADDYLTKPFSRDDVLQAVNARMARAAAAARREAQRLSAREQQLQLMFQNSMMGQTQDRLDVNPADARSAEAREATVLFSDIRGFTTMSEQLSAQEVAELLNAYFRAVCEPIVAARGEALKFIGDGVMAVFCAEPDARHSHAYRALQAALGMTLAAHRFGTWMHERYANRGLPAFAIGVGVHSGEVMMCHVGSDDSSEFTAIGDAVNLASRLEGKTKELGWSVIASLPTLHAAGEGIEFGDIETLWVKGRSTPVDAVEITGIDVTAGAVDSRHVELATDIRNALRSNSEITGRAIKAALQVTQKMETLPSTAGNFAATAPKVKGYRLLRKLGEGGMSEVFLAERESDQMPVALKVLDPSVGELDEGVDLLARFIQEYAIISQINHPNVVRIFDQAFSDELAYIAMEYFPGGDLRRKIAAGMTSSQVVEILLQTSRALDEVHKQGIVHRDLKPDNLMLRADGSLALVDFGVAKRTRQSLASTRHGQVVGTPYYLSPEQAATGAVTNKSDLYSLGVLAYEMFTGEKPYQADNVETLMRLHVDAAVPRLPAPVAQYQPLIDRLMAKDPVERFQSAGDVVTFLMR
jgi:class 3 adenylate cyclase